MTAASPHLIDQAMHKDHRTCATAFATYFPVHLDDTNVPTSITQITKERKNPLDNPSKIEPFFINPHSKDKTQKNIAGYLFVYDDQIIIAYRGTKYAKDWSVNRRCKTTLFHFGNDTYAKVHTGFLERYLASEKDMRAKLSNLLENDPSKPLTVVGHSQGGAIAQIAALSLTKNPVTHQSSIQGVVTFGSARVFGKRSVSTYNSSLRDKTTHIKTKNDPVPSAGLTSYFNATGHKISPPENRTGYSVKAHLSDSYKTLMNNISAADPQNSYARKLSNNIDLTESTINQVLNNILSDINPKKSATQWIKDTFGKASPTYDFWMSQLEILDNLSKQNIDDARKKITYAALAHIADIKIKPPANLSAAASTEHDLNNTDKTKHLGIFLRFLFRNKYEPPQIRAIQRIALSEGFSLQDKWRIIKDIADKEINEMKDKRKKNMPLYSKLGPVYKLALKTIENSTEGINVNSQTSQYLLLCEQLKYTPANLETPLQKLGTINTPDLKTEMQYHFNNLNINKTLSNGAKTIVKILQRSDISLAVKQAFLVELAENKRFTLFDKIHTTNKQKLYKAIIEHQEKDSVTFFNQVADDLKLSPIEEKNNSVKNIAIHVNETFSTLLLSLRYPSSFFSKKTTAEKPNDDKDLLATNSPQ